MENTNKPAQKPEQAKAAPEKTTTAAKKAEKASKQPKPKKEKKDKKSSPLIWIIIVVLLLGGAGALGYLFMTEKKKVEEKIQEVQDLNKKNEDLQNQIAQLQDDLAALETENGNLLNEKNDLTKQLEDLKAKLEYEKKHGDAAKLRYYKSKFNELSSKVDELNTTIENLKKENTQLQSDKKQLTSSLDQAETKNKELEGENKDLNDQVTLGSILHAHDVFVDGVKEGGLFGKKEKPITKAKKVEKIRVSFAIGKNLIAKPEMKSVFITITDPKGNILSKGDDPANQFTVNGEKKVFSLKQEFQYDNSESPMTVYYNVKEELMAGKYVVELYCDEALIGKEDLKLE